MNADGPFIPNGAFNPFWPLKCAITSRDESGRKG